MCYNEFMVKKKSPQKNNLINKTKNHLAEIIIIILIVITCGIGGFFLIKNIKTADYVVETNAFFAPFEYYDGQKIKGVDIEIIDKVATKLGKTIDVKDVEFDVIIDNVAAGKIADAGVAGLTITDARLEKVNFSIPYYNSVQYVIYNKNATVNLRDGHVIWNDLAGKVIGSQTGGTGYLFAQDEIENGALAGTNTTLKGFESHQLAADAIKSGMLDFAIADELPAKYIVSKNPDLLAVPLYQSQDGADFPVEEAYAVAVNKNQTELLDAFNAVLEEMLTPGQDGKTEMDKLILKYMGLNE